MFAGQRSGIESSKSTCKDGWQHVFARLLPDFAGHAGLRIATWHLRIAAKIAKNSEINRCSAAKWMKPLSEKSRENDQPTLIKKYANRRLYNTSTSSYVTLDHLCTMVKAGEEFVVEDAKSGEDITRSVLTQIIFEEEGKGQNLLPINFLRQLIGFYGDNLQPVVPEYLEFTMQSFAKNQEAMRENMTNALGGANPFSQLEEMTRTNVNMFQQALGAFTPFQMPGMAGTGETSGSQDADRTAAPAGESSSADTTSADDLTSLKDKLADLEKQIDKLSEK
jgi:polyhydroxyalkanoate synthesis repressor PhaR